MSAHSVLVEAALKNKKLASSGSAGDSNLLNLTIDRWNQNPLDIELAIDLIKTANDYLHIIKPERTARSDFEILFSITRCIIVVLGLSKSHKLKEEEHLILANVMLNSLTLHEDYLMLECHSERDRQGLKNEIVKARADLECTSFWIYLLTEIILHEIQGTPTEEQRLESYYGIYQVIAATFQEKIISNTGIHIEISLMRARLRMNPEYYNLQEKLVLNYETLTKAELSVYFTHIINNFLWPRFILSDDNYREAMIRESIELINNIYSGKSLQTKRFLRDEIQHRIFMLEHNEDTLASSLCMRFLSALTAIPTPDGLEEIAAQPNSTAPLSSLSMFQPQLEDSGGGNAPEKNWYTMNWCNVI